MNLKFYKTLLVVLVLMAASIIPLFLKDRYIHILIMMLFYGYLGVCWNIVGGLTGMLSLCHGTLAGVSAFIAVSLFTRLGMTPWIGMFLGAAFAGIVGMGIAHIASRYGLRSMYFALLTLSFSEIVRLLTLHWEFVGGASGLLIPISNKPFMNYQFGEKIHFYYVILAMQIMAILISYMLTKSKMGYYLMAIKENEDAAETVGVNTSKYKIAATGLSSFLTGFGGVFYAQYLMYISPDVNLSLDYSIEIVSGAILGGTGSSIGPLIGACVLQVLSELFRVFLGELGTVHLIAYGLMLMLVIMYMPKGIVGSLKELVPS